MDDSYGTPRSGRTKKKSTLSKLALRKGSGLSDDSDANGSKASLRDSRSRDDLADAMNRSRLNSENYPQYPVDARVEIGNAGNIGMLEDDSDEGIGLGHSGAYSGGASNHLSSSYNRPRSSVPRVTVQSASPRYNQHDSVGNYDVSGQRGSPRMDMIKGEKRFREQNSDDGDDLYKLRNKKHPSKYSDSDDDEDETGYRMKYSDSQSSPRARTSARGSYERFEKSTKSDSEDDDDMPMTARLRSSRSLELQSTASPRHNNSMREHLELEERYRNILQNQANDDDDDDETRELGDSLSDLRHSGRGGRSYSPPRPSAMSPTPYSRFNSNHPASASTDSHATSNVFMSMAMKNRPGQTDGMSEMSLQSTSVLPLISTKEARNRSFLVGSINSSGSLLGADELKRFFPEKKMRIFIGTWNMCELKQVPGCVDDFLLPETSDYIHDAYIIGTQESTPNREEWEITLQETLGPQLVLFHSAAFGVLYLNIFLRRDLIWYCSVTEEASVSTRAGPSGMKTKGGLGVCFTLFGTSFLFVNSHLTPHDGKAKERAADYRKICAGLALPQTLPRANTKGADEDVTARFDCVFWMGDLNFRLDKEREHVDQTVKGIEGNDIPSYDDLVQHDELFKARNEGLAFEAFQEGRIKFKPTYKYDIGTDEFDTKKMRIPSYTDRILYRVRKKGSVTCLYYDGAHNIKVSDHRPVYAMFEVDLRPGRDNIPLSGGQFKRQVWLQANARRASKLTAKHNEKSSKVCSIQ